MPDIIFFQDLLPSPFPLRINPCQPEKNQRTASPGMMPAGSKRLSGPEQDRRGTEENEENDER